MYVLPFHSYPSPSMLKILIHKENVYFSILQISKKKKNILCTTIDGRYFGGCYLDGNLEGDHCLLITRNSSHLQGALVLDH